MLRRLFLAGFAALLFAVPAEATTLALLTFTTAKSAQTTPVLQRRTGTPQNIVLQANFTYGSGGTTVDAWVQTSCDSGGTWLDIANFHFTTSSARFLYNLNSQTAVTSEYTATDGSLSANTAKDGLLCSQYRVKWTTTGTYAASTTLQLDAQGPGAGFLTQ